MSELTLESLAERVAALERVVEQVTRLRAHIRPGKPTVYYRPGTGDWAAAEQAARELSKTYDFEAVRLQDECDWEEARRVMLDSQHPQ